MHIKQAIAPPRKERRSVTPQKSCQQILLGPLSHIRFSVGSGADLRSLRADSAIEWLYLALIKKLEYTRIETPNGMR